MDLELYLFMLSFSLKEEKDKKYTEREVPSNIVYIFDDEDNYENYFYKYMDCEVCENIFDICRLKTMKSGKVLALKCACDFAIMLYRDRSYQEALDDIKKADLNNYNLGHSTYKNNITKEDEKIYKICMK